MITFQNVHKHYPSRVGKVEVLRGIDFTIERGEKVGIIGRNGAGKSTLVRLISGIERPSAGQITRNMSVSWPLAFGGAFQPTLSGLDNLKFICRIYGVDYRDKVQDIERFSELGAFLKEPMKMYSSGMCARLAFAVSMAIEFDCFLIDEIVAVGDAKFQQKCHNELFQERADRAMIIVSHDLAYIAGHCDRAIVVENGKAILFSDIYEAGDYYIASFK